MTGLRLNDLAREVCLVFNKLHHRYAICGAIALALHGYPRGTLDIDLLVESGSAARAGIEAIRPLGWLPAADEIPLPKDWWLARAIRPDGTHLWMLDLIVPPDPEAWLADRELSEIDGGLCWVLSRASLRAMKMASERPKDRLDVINLDGDGDG